jgi:hypothetical protein
MADNSLIDLGSISKPLDTLITKLADGAGVLYEPTRIRRKARAESDAKTIAKLADMELNELERRAMGRLIREEGIKQANIEAIIDAAVPDIAPAANAAPISNDWIAMFMDRAKLISEREVQTIWSKILASEVNQPGSISRQTLSILNSLDQHDASTFERLATFCWTFNGEPTVVLFDIGAPVYVGAGLTFVNVMSLDVAGLIRYDHIAGFNITIDGGPLVATYHDTVFHLDHEPGNNLNVGHAMLTRAGAELLAVCKPQKNENYLEYCTARWSANIK